MVCGTRSSDQRLKRDVYERTGVREYWLLNPDKDVVDVYRPGSAGSRFAAPIRYDSSQSLTSPLLPELRVPLEKIFGRDKDA